MEIGQVLSIVGTAMVPVLELKAAIIAGVGFGMPVWEVFWWALLGAAIPVPLIIWLGRPVMAALKKTKLFRPFIEWLERRALKKSANVQRLAYLGLFIFVAIPLPTTGVWTGSLISLILDLKPLPSLICVLLGNVVAGLLVLAFSYGVFSAVA